MALAPIRRFLLRLLNLVARRRAERELSREVSAHLALLEDDLVGKGLTAKQARAAALQALDIARTKERHREVRSFVIIEHVWRDVRYAVRALAASPGFTAAAIVTIALGIGASTAMFSVAYGVALRPLPYPDPDRLVRLYESNPSQGQLRQDVSEPAFFAWRRSAASFESMAMYGKAGTRLLNQSEQRPVTLMFVSPEFFQLIGIPPLLGTVFKPETYTTRGDDAVLSYAGWQRLFGGRTNVIGDTIEFEGAGEPDPYRIVGVMPQDFAFAEPVDVWITGFIREPVSRSGVVWNWRYDRVVARLQPGAAIERARAELETVASRIAAERPASNGGWTVTVDSLHDSIVGTFRRVSWLLLATVVVVLLLACLNVGGLLVARSIAREREMAVRIALGAGRIRLISLRLAEAAVISGAGGAMGLLLAYGGLLALKAAAPPGIPRLDAIAVDSRTLLATAVCIVCSVGAFTIAPQRQPRHQLAEQLHAGAAAAGDGPRRYNLRAALTLAQCAGATVLVVLAVLLTRSLVRLMSVELGWNPAGVVRLNVSPRTPPGLRAPWFVYVDWSDRLIAELETTSGIERAAITTQVPLSDWYPSTLGRGRGAAAKDAGRWPTVRHSVSDGYFDAMAIRLLSGRIFGTADRQTEAQLTGKAPRDRGVAIVSVQTARTLWPDRSAIGEAVWIPDDGTSAGWREVVGVVEDIQFHAIGETPALHVFIPWTESPTGRPRLIVKTREATPSTVAAIRAVVDRIEPDTLIESIVPLEGLVSRATAQPRFTSRIIAAFGALALALAAVGIYGTLAYLVRARTREIGIRLALGASQRAIVTSVLTRAMVPAIAGAAIGLVSAGGLAGAFRALLFNVDPLDRGAFAAGALVLLVVALAAALVPALRAARVDPAHTLRTE